MGSRRLVSVQDYLKSEDREDLVAAKSVSDEPNFNISDRLLKVLDLELTKAERDTSIVMTISTEAIDRDGDILRVKGWKTANFKKNPVVPWAHSHFDLPIGKAQRVWRDIPSNSDRGPRLRALKTFAVQENEMAETVFALLKGGFLKTASVGFIPHTWEPREKTEDEEKRTFTPSGFVFKSMDLLESSIVPIPSNPEALVEARSYKGLNLSPIKTYVERALDGEIDVPLIGRDQLEESWRHAGFAKGATIVEDDSDSFDESKALQDVETENAKDDISSVTIALANAIESLKNGQEITITKGSEGSEDPLFVVKIRDGVCASGPSLPALTDDNVNDNDNLIHFDPELFRSIET